MTIRPLFPIELREKSTIWDFKIYYSPFGVDILYLQSFKELLQQLIDNYNKSIKESPV